MTFETTLALLFVGAWVSIIGGWAMHYLLQRYKFIN